MHVINEALVHKSRSRNPPQKVNKNTLLIK